MPAASCIECRQLNCHLDAASRASFVGAAAALGITQPAVSKAIGEPEGAPGVKRFIRSRAGVALTPQGEALRRHAGAAISALRQGPASVNETRRPSTVTVAFGALPTVTGELVPVAVLAAKRDSLAARVWLVGTIGRP
ncbi:MAG: LysR family transcriptional regulator [Cucumibacter sp.]